MCEIRMVVCCCCWSTWSLRLSPVVNSAPWGFSCLFISTWSHLVSWYTDKQLLSTQPPQLGSNHSLRWWSHQGEARFSSCRQSKHHGTHFPMAISVADRGPCSHWPLLSPAHPLLICFPDYLTPNTSHDTAAHVLRELKEAISTGMWIKELYQTQKKGQEDVGHWVKAEFGQGNYWGFAFTIWPPPLPWSWPERKHCASWNQALVVIWETVGSPRERGHHLVAEFWSASVRGTFVVRSLQGRRPVQGWSILRIL